MKWPSSAEKKEADSNDEEENSASDDEEMDETYAEEVEEDPEEEMEEDSEQTLIEIVQAARKSYKDKKAASPSKEESAYQNKDENVETAEEKEPCPKKYGRGKDITKDAAVMKAQRADKIALRSMSRSKYFEFDSLETKGWDLKKFTDPQGWTNFVSLSKVCKSQSLNTFSLKL